MDTKRWSGRKAQEHVEPIGKIDQWIPFFTRTSGWSLVDEGLNKYLDVIIREPLESDAKYIKDRLRIPVCTVTKRYALFQHQEVFNALVTALKKRVPDLDSLKANLCITEYGERMWLRFSLANFQLDEAERYPMLLEVNGLNTIVPGTALDIRLSWYEPESEIRIPYGMLTGILSVQGVNFKIPHLRKETGLDSDIFSREINQFLRGHLENLSYERERYIRWKSTMPTRRSLTRWIDTTVQKKWKYEEAVRAYNLIMNGWDVEVIRPANVDREQKGNNTETLPAPSKLPEGPLPFPSAFFIIIKDPVSSTDLERFTPARNAFDVSLVLAWIVSQRGAIPDRLKWTDIPELMDALVVEDEQLKRIIK